MPLRGVGDLFFHLLVMEAMTNVPIGQQLAVSRETDLQPPDLDSSPCISLCF